MKKGCLYEYILNNKFNKNGFKSYRLGNNKPIDLIISSGFNKYAIEIKHRLNDVLYVTKKQLVNINDFCYFFDFKLLFVVKFNNNPFYCFSLSDFKELSSNYKLTVNDLYKGVLLTDFIKDNRNNCI